MKLPRIISYSIHMGRMTQSYLRFTLHSIKLNSGVQFVLINVVVHDSDASRVRRIASIVGASNFHVEVIPVQEFTRRCREVLGIELPINDGNAYVGKYAYKLAEFKPALALLFPEQMTLRAPSATQPFDFWGYCDMDIIWGNFSRFAYFFQGQYDVVSTNSVRLMGMATFYRNEPWTRGIFMSDKIFLKNLADFENHYCSDEFGQCKVPMFHHSMDHIVRTELLRRNGSWNMPMRQMKDRVYVETMYSMEYYGPVVWFQGVLNILNGCGEKELHSTFDWKKNADGCPEFDPMREILFYHRIPRDFDLMQRLPFRIAREIADDMLKYGFLLPNMIPLFTRHVCPEFRASGTSSMSGMIKYSPFKCFERPGFDFSRTAGDRPIEPSRNSLRTANVNK